MSENKTYEYEWPTSGGPVRVSIPKEIPDRQIGGVLGIIQMICEQIRERREEQQAMEASRYSAAATSEVNDDTET